MGDDGAGEPLMTLHFYTPSIDVMVVYGGSDTHIVDGSCGAWVPFDRPDQIRRSFPGIVARSALA